MSLPPFFRDNARGILAAAGLVLAFAAWQAFRPETKPEPFVCPFHPHHEGEHAHHAPVEPTWKSLDAHQGLALLADLKARHEADPKDMTLLSEWMHVALDFDPATALRISEDLLAKDPDNLFALHHGALALMHLQKPQAALAYATRCLSLDDTAENRTIVGHIHRLMGQETHAMAFFGKALELDPAYRPALIGLGRTEAVSP